MKRYYLLIFALVLFAFPVFQAFAERPEGDESERHERMREAMTQKLVKYLELSDEQRDRIVPLMEESFKEAGLFREERRNKAKEIFQMKGDDTMPVSELNTIVDDLEKLDRKMEESSEVFLKKAKTILSDRQYVKLRLFHDRLRFDLVERFAGEKSKEGRSEFRGGDSRTLGALQRSNEDLKRSMAEIQQSLREIQQSVREIQATVGR